MKAPFFRPGRENFFQPITGPWREVVVQLVIAMYDSFLGGSRRVSHYIERSDLKDMAIGAIQDYPVLSGEFEEEDREFSLKDEGWKANEIIRRLRHFGWLEPYVDPGTNREVFRFTRAGKNGAQWLAEQDAPALRMTQRNVRNTKNALLSYQQKGDAYDLFMALEHSQKITHDLADDIAEIHEKRRVIVAEAVHEIALLDYVKFMNGKFAPVMAVKLRADSVYRHERDIQEIIAAFKTTNLSDSEKSRALEQGARVFRPQTSYEEGSVVLRTLEDIQVNLRDAIDNKMRELADAVAEYTDRTSFLALQASVIASAGSVNAMNRTLKAVASLMGDPQDAVLAQMSAELRPFRLALVDESIVRLRKGQARPRIDSVQRVRVITREERLDAFLRKAEERAFSVSIKDMRERVEDMLQKSPEVLLSQIPINSYDDILFVGHLLEAAANPEVGAMALKATPLGIRRDNVYMAFDEFSLKPKGASKGAKNG